MNCMEARRMITPFVKKELSLKDTEDFLNHVENCEDCMEELDIYYIAFHASDLLDSKDKHEYDFEKMLQEEIRSARRSISRSRFASLIRMAVVSVSELLLIISILFGANLKAGGPDTSILQRILFSSTSENLSEGMKESESDTDLTGKVEESYETENRTD